MGGLFGGGGSSSSATTKTTNVTTTTTSKVGDVGLTGGNAVDAIKALISGVTDVAKVQSGTVNAISQESGKNYQQLVGGAGKLIETAPVATGAVAAQTSNDYMKMLIPAALLIGGIMIAKQF